MPPKTLKDDRKWAAIRIEALNHALKGLPEERTRYEITMSLSSTSKACGPIRLPAAHSSYSARHHRRCSVAGRHLRRVLAP